MNGLDDGGRPALEILDEERITNEALRAAVGGLMIVPDRVEDLEELREPAAPAGLVSYLEARGPISWARGRGVPIEHVSLLYQTPKLDRSRVTIRASLGWLHNRRALWALMLHGKVGRGKSLAAALLACDRSLSSVVWISAEDYVNLARTPAGNAEILDRIEKADLVVLDDLGEEYADKSGYNLHMLRRLITKRKADNPKPWAGPATRRIVITTNLSPKQFATRYGDRVADRVRDQGALVAAINSSTFDGEDLGSMRGVEVLDETAGRS